MGKTGDNIRADGQRNKYEFITLERIYAKCMTKTVEKIHMKYLLYTKCPETITIKFK